MARLGCRYGDLVVLAMKMPVPWTSRMRLGGQVTFRVAITCGPLGVGSWSILVEDYVSYPVESVLYLPVPLGPGGDHLGLGIGHGQGADPGRLSQPNCSWPCGFWWLGCVGPEQHVQPRGSPPRLASQQP